MRKKSRRITLIEIMIVILLIGLIGGALAFNMRGSLDEGKAFKTRQNQERIENILMLEIAKGTLDPNKLTQAKWEKVVKASPLVKDGNQAIKDGWGNSFTVSYNDGQVVVTSDSLNQYENN